MAVPDTETEMRSQYEIVPASDGNRIARAKLLQAAWREAYPNEEAGLSQEDIDAYSETFTTSESLARVKRSEEAAPDEFFCVALDGKLVGFGNVYGEGNEVKGMYVHPDYYGTGAGAKLMQEAIARLDSSRDIVLKVAAYNDRAIRFYEKFGFERKGPSHDRPIGNGKALPTILMVRPASD